MQVAENQVFKFRRSVLYPLSYGRKLLIINVFFWPLSPTV